MKLIFAVLHDEDARVVIDALNSEKYTATRLCSTGGFLRAGNTTIMLGIEDEELDNILSIIKRNSKTHRQKVRPTARTPLPLGMDAGEAVEITVGGATIFVTKVERMEKY